MRRVILESPYAGDVEANVAYARRAVHDCLMRGEAAIASHLLFTQPGVIDDAVPLERQLGIAGGHAWMGVADAAVCYMDRGMSHGMKHGISGARLHRIPVEYRWLDDDAPLPAGVLTLAKI